MLIISNLKKSKLTVIHRRSPIQESEIEVVIKEMESIYSEEFWHETNLDIHDEIEKYNILSTNKNISFQDYFAFRDYTEAGYVRVNNAIRSNNITPEIKIEIEQLTNALKSHSDMNTSLKNRSLKNLSYDDIDIVYRGEVRNRAEFEAEIVEEKPTAMMLFLVQRQTKNISQTLILKISMTEKSM